MCVERETLRDQWIAARADYQLALADLQVSTATDDFREALTRANQTFTKFQGAEGAFKEHVQAHGCAQALVFTLSGRTLAKA